jgi:hypothetical protein
MFSKRCFVCKVSTALDSTSIANGHIAADMRKRPNRGIRAYGESTANVAWRPCHAFVSKSNTIVC